MKNIAVCDAIKIFIGMLLAVTIFHLCILFKIIPYHIAWGGKLNNDEEMYVFETVSVLINVFLIIILLMKGNFISYKFSEKSIKVLLWIFFGVFILNTIGNLFAKNIVEKFFTILTGLSAFFIWKINKEKKEFS